MKLTEERKEELKEFLDSRDWEGGTESLAIHGFNFSDDHPFKSYWEKIQYELGFFEGSLKEIMKENNIEY